MATFNPKSFEKKLKSLDPTQTAIQTLSLWILHHRHHAEPITTTWLEQIRKTSRSDKKLGLFYLVNDVVQNGRKKAKELVTAFGGVLLEALPLLRDAKIKNQIERVFNIWLERNVYDGELIDTFKQRIEPSPVKAKPEKKEKRREKEEKAAAAAAASTVVRKTVPANFKVSSLLVSIKKATSYDSEVDRKSNALDTLKIDASSFDSVKHVKDRSSVGRFHKQFEESKILLEDYIQTLRRCQRDKIVLMALLSGSEVFYEVAQEEAKVIVNAYKTFGNRLNSMKKKLDSKIRRMEEDSPGDSSIPQNNMMTKNIELKSHSKYNQLENSNIQDMDLDSDSDTEASDRYDLMNAPVNDETFNASLSSPRAFSSSESQDDTFVKPHFQTMESREDVPRGLDQQLSINAALLNQPLSQEAVFGSPEAAQKEQQEFLNFHNQLLLSQQKQTVAATILTENAFTNIISHGGALSRQPSLDQGGIPLLVQTPTTELAQQPQTIPVSPRMVTDPFTQPGAPPILPVTINPGMSSNSTSPPTVVQQPPFFNGVTSIYDFPGMPSTSTMSGTQSKIDPITPDALRIAEENAHNNPLLQRLNSSSNLPTPVQDESEKNDKNGEKQQPLQSLIDSLFPVLSKSLQTIKEKQQAKDDGTKPSVSEAMQFALEGASSQEDVPRKKGRFNSKETSPSAVACPLSLTNPKGLSDNQTELISIAAGLTKFDENFLPVNEEMDGEDSLEAQAAAQAPPDTVDDMPTSTSDQAFHDDASSLKENDDHEKKERKSRHRHRSHKDEDKRKLSSSSPSRRSSHRDDERHKKSSSRSPSRRNSHRSSRDSRDERHSERRRSRRSPSPRRRKGSRGRRSQSRERERGDDSKRRRSPEKAPYYNDRRSPTPEMDSSPRQTAFPGNVIPNQIPIIQNTAFQIPSSSTLNMEEMLNPGLYQGSDDVASTTGANNISLTSGGTNDEDLLNNGAKPPDINTILLSANQLRPVGPAIINYDGVGGPMLLPGNQIRLANPVQVMNPRAGVDQPNILHLRPLPPGVIPINMGGQIIMQDELNVNAIDNAPHEGEADASPDGPIRNDNPLLELSKHAPHNENEHVVGGFDQPIPSSQGLQRPPIVFQGPPEFRPRFGGPGARPVPPPFDEPRPHRFNGPRHQRFDGPRGRFDNQRGPRFDGPRGPRFDRPRGPRFDGPRGHRFDGPPGPPHFDGPPRPPRFDGPPNNHPRFDGPPHFEEDMPDHRDEHIDERNLHDGPDRRPKRAEPDPLLDQLEAQQKHEPPHMTSPRREDDYRSKFKPFHDQRGPPPRFRPRFRGGGNGGPRFRPRFERPRFRPPRPAY